MKSNELILAEAVSENWIELDEQTRADTAYMSCRFCDEVGSLSIENKQAELKRAISIYQHTKACPVPLAKKIIANKK